MAYFVTVWVGVSSFSESQVKGHNRTERPEKRTAAQAQSKDIFFFFFFFFFIIFTSFPRLSSFEVTLDFTALSMVYSEREDTGREGMCQNGTL
jgi:Trk-type K+ transport system membrane component